MAIALTLVALVPLGAALTITYLSFHGALTEEVRSRLSVIVDNKTKRVDGYMLGLTREIQALSTSPDLLQIVAEQGSRETEHINRIIETYAGSFDYAGLFIISADGVVLGSASSGLSAGQSIYEATVRDTGLGEIAARLLASEPGSREGPGVSRFLGFGEKGELESFIIAPMFVDGLRKGMIAAQISKSLLFRIIDDRTGLGETGAVYIAMDHDGTPELLTSTASGPEMSTPRPSPEQIRQILGAQSGQAGSASFKDHRGTRVVAAFNNAVSAFNDVPSYGWTLMVSVDETEAFASANSLRLASYVIFGITTLIVMVVSLLMGQAISIPIRKLSQATRVVSDGDLGRRVDIRGLDEIALLGNDFNHMIDLIADYREQIEANLSRQTRLGSELQTANDNLKRALEHAETSNRSKSEFLANMSHEIRTPLNGVLGLADLLIDDGPNDTDLKKLNLIKQCGQSLLDILNDILDISKLEAGRVELQAEPVDVRELVGFVVESFSFRAEEKSIDLTFDIAPDTPVTILADPIRLRQILFNLIGNAVKFTDAGYVRVEVGVREEPFGGALVEIRVMDTGIGISSGAQGLIFDRFSQDLGAGEQLYGGTGLGLAICKQLIDLMGGDISVESEAGMGSTFVVTVPMLEEVGPALAEASG